MKTRRSPIKHTVSSYKRKDGTKVGSYPRGSGTRTKTRRSRRVGRIDDDDDKIGIHGFVVNFKYSDKKGDGESVIVFSDNFADATDEAFEERVDQRNPLSVEVVDPDIGAMLEWTGKRVRSAIKYGKPKIKKAAHLGAKFTIRATMASGRTAKKVAKAGVSGAKELGRLTAFGVQKEIIQSLLKLCYQDDPAKRIAARATLKRRYPDIFDMCDFSRERSHVRRPRTSVPKTTYFPKRIRKIP